MTAPAAAEIRVSWSRLRMHDECPAKGELMRRHKSPTADIRDFFPGNVTDLLMRRWLEQEVPELGWMAAQVDEVFEESAAIAKRTGDGIVRWRGPNDKAETREFCRELVIRLEPILAKYALPFDWQPAKRFQVPITMTDDDGQQREIVLIGETDLLVRDCAGRIAVWDLKATRNNDYYKKVLGQLAFYALAVKAMTGELPVITGLIQPMCTQRVLPVSVGRDEVAQIVGRIEKVARDIMAGRLAPKADNAGCAYCQVRHACPKFKVAGKSGRPAVAAA